MADTAGVGTTMYAAAYDEFRPRFGADSRAAHLEQGAREIDGELPSLRRDVDDLDDLDHARHLGLGPHTVALDDGPGVHRPEMH